MNEQELLVQAYLDDLSKKTQEAAMYRVQITLLADQVEEKDKRIKELENNAAVPQEESADSK